MPDQQSDPAARSPEERRRELDGRERAAWDEYLGVSKGCAGDLERYHRAEPLAWRRLRRALTDVAHERRRDAREQDRLRAAARAMALAG